MDIYTRKYNYKILLLVIASIIGLSTLIYTNYITTKIANEEKRKAKLWAEAIMSRAKLVRYTNDLFTRLATDERKKVNIWAQSTKFIISVENNEELNFFSEIITSNTDIPVALADHEGKIIDVRNIEVRQDKASLNINDTLFDKFRIYPPIVVSYFGKSNFIYYQDSKLFTELKSTLNEIISSFITEVVINTASAPVLLMDDSLQLLAYGNLDSCDVDEQSKITTLIKNMQSKHEPIKVDLGDGVHQQIYFDDSEVLSQLKIFPLIQLLIFAAFALFSYLAMSNARRAEQNQVWVGLAKETAHQLGTPISSISAWVEYLRDNKADVIDASVIEALDHDVERLTLVADRFSKIGAQPQLVPALVQDTIAQNVDYIKQRSSKQVAFHVASDDPSLEFLVNHQLFNWVIENLLKNALDAMDGVGTLTINTASTSQLVIIDISDTGCGIPKGKHKTIFEPGFSTKRRGWGLGLSLTKRIVEEYHHGRIYVKNSEPNMGTTFRIELPRYFPTA